MLRHTRPFRAGQQGRGHLLGESSLGLGQALDHRVQFGQAGPQELDVGIAATQLTPLLECEIAAPVLTLPSGSRAGAGNRPRSAAATAGDGDERGPPG